MKTADPSDRRSASRYSAPEGTFVLVWTPTSEFTGFLVDISIKGAGFEYVLLDEALKEGYRIDICSDRDQLRVENLPFELVTDVEVSDSGMEPVIWRRAGIFFTNLSEEGRRQLAELIRKWGNRVFLATSAAATDTRADDRVFLARLKLLTIAAKAYLGGYPYGFHRERAVSRNAKEIRRLLPRQNVFQFGETHSPLLEKHIVQLATAFSEFPVKTHHSALLEENIDCISDSLSMDKSLKPMAFLKVA